MLLGMYMKKIFLLLFLLAAVCGSTSICAQTVEEIEFEITNKEVQGTGRYANLVLYGQHDTYGKITIYLNEYNGNYKTYEVYYATLGKLNLTGSAQWSKDGKVEILDANLSTAPFDKEPTADDQVFHIIGTYTPQEIVTLNFSGFSQFGYDSNYKDWFMRMEGTDPGKPEYGYRLELAYYAPANNGFGTFTTANNDINMADTHLQTPSGYVMFDSVTLIVEQKKVSDNLTQTIANATLLGEDGVTYIVTCVHNSITPTQQITAVITNTSLSRNEDSFTLDGMNDNAEATITIKSNKLVGKYAMKQIDLQQTYFFYNEEKLDILSIQAEVATELKNNNLACITNVALLTRDTILYVFKMTHTFSAPTDSVELKATNLIINDALSEELGVVSFDAKNEQYILSGAWMATEAEEGTYSKEDVTIELQDVQNNTTIHSLDAIIDVKKDNSAHWTITGTMRGDDNVVYNLNLSYVVPTPQDTVLVRFNHSAIATFTPDMNNDLFFENKDEHYYASINIRGVEMGSAFSLQNVDRDYCGVKDSITGKYTELADINGRIFQLGDTTIMQAELISMDATLYDIELWYVVPTPIDTVTLSFPVEFGDLRNEEGYYQLYGPSSDTTYIVAFSPLSEDIEGTFVYDGMFGKFGAEGGRMEMEYRNTYIAKMEGDYVTAIMPLEEGTMTVTMDQDGNITAVAEAICADSVYYHITMTAHYEREYLRGDMPFGSIERTYTAADILSTMDKSEEEGWIYLAVGAADQSDLMAMHFFVDSTDADILIPEGEYKINKSFRPGTVLGNAGPDDQNQISTPFYATVDNLGYLTNIYMWVKGTVTVAKKDGKLYLEVNALNSYDVPIHIIYDGSISTSLPNVHSPISNTHKIIRNGQLIILKDGAEYNAQGIQIQ